MKPLILLTAAVVAVATLTTAAAPIGAEAAPPVRAPSAAPAPKQHRDRSLEAMQIHRLRHGIVWHRARTWHFQDALGIGRTPTRFAERRIRAVGFLRWDVRLWSHRHDRAKHAFASHLLPYTNDWVTAVRIVQRVWPGTSSWLLSCSGGEGAHGVWVWNGGTPLGMSVAEAVRQNKAGTLVVHGSGAGGWMQYMEGTFDGQFAAAMYAARTTHRALPPPQSRNWFSALGQAFAAGRARYIGMTSAWSPGIDPACA